MELLAHIGDDREFDFSYDEIDPDDEDEIISSVILDHYIKDGTFSCEGLDQYEDMLAFARRELDEEIREYAEEKGVDPDDVEIRLELEGVDPDEYIAGFDWEFFRDFPFAAEVVNGSILSLTKELQEEALRKTLEKYAVTKERFAEYLSARYPEYEYGEDYEDYLDDEDDEDGEDGPDAPRLTKESFPELQGLNDRDAAVLYELYGFDPEGGFNPGGIGFMDSGSGFAMSSLLDHIGLYTSEYVNSGAHGHDATGVYCIWPGKYTDD